MYSTSWSTFNKNVEKLELIQEKVTREQCARALCVCKCVPLSVCVLREGGTILKERPWQQTGLGSVHGRNFLVTEADIEGEGYATSG